MNRLDMENQDLISFLDQYGGGYQEGQLERWPFRERDEEPPDWVRDRIPEWDGHRPRYGVPYVDYDIDAIFDQENQASNRPDISDLDEDRDLSDEEVEVLVKEYADTVGDAGFEALAWYTPFHYTRRHWGIYIKEDGIRLLGNLLYAWSRGRVTGDIRINVFGDDTRITHTFSGDPIPSRRTAAEMALEILLRHEWMHHQVELLATYLEDLYDTPLYEQYQEDAYHTTFAESDCLEESVANAYVANSYAVRKLAPTGSFNDLFKLSTMRQPEAYREYQRFTRDKLTTGCRHLAHLIRNPEAEGISDEIGNRAKQLAIGDRLPFERDIEKAAERGQIPIYILKPKPEREEVFWFKAISLDDFYTDYDIIQTESFEKAYNKADGSVRDRVDSQVEKLRESIHHNGFEWRPCEDGLSYLRINEQYRMIARRDDHAQKIELIDFSTDHDLPEEYGCYQNT